MRANFEKFGIQFQYPDNWTLETDDMLGGQSSATVYSPGGAFWSVTVHDAADDPADLIDAVVATMRTTYEDLDSEDTDETLYGREVIGCDMNFYCLDLTNTAEVRVFESARGNFVVLWQAEDREYAEIHRVFQAMTASLLQESSWLNGKGDL